MWLFQRGFMFIKVTPAPEDDTLFNEFVWLVFWICWSNLATHCSKPWALGTGSHDWVATQTFWLKGSWLCGKANNSHWREVEITAPPVQLKVCPNFGNGRCFFGGLVHIVRWTHAWDLKSYFPPPLDAKKLKFDTALFQLLNDVYYNATHLHHTSHCTCLGTTTACGICFSTEIYCDSPWTRYVALSLLQLLPPRHDVWLLVLWWNLIFCVGSDSRYHPGWL